MVCEFFDKQEKDAKIEWMLEKLMLHMELGQDKREELVVIQQKLENVLSQDIPGCRLSPFGSNVYGLSIFESDLDLSLFLQMVTDRVPLSNV